MGLISRVSSRTYRRARFWLLVGVMQQDEKTCNVEQFLTSIRKARDIEDRIIYRLNDAVRTKSMTGKQFNTQNAEGCDSLKQELNAGRLQREAAIRDCLAAHEVALTSYKASLDAGEDGFRRSYLKTMQTDRRALI